MLRSKPIAAIFFIVFVDVLAFTLVLPYLPFFAERFGASPTQVGLILTSFAFCQFLAGPVLGKMSDIMGRKPVLIVSQIGTCLGFVMLALANSLPMIYFARVLDGITAGNITVAQAALSDITKPTERARVFSLIGVAFGLGFFVGPAISALLGHFGETAPSWGAAGLSFLSILSTTFLFKDSPEAHPSPKPFHLNSDMLRESLNLKPLIAFFKVPSLRTYLLQFLFFNLSFSAHISCFALFAERRLTHNGMPFGPKEVAYLYAYLGFLGIFVRSFVINGLIKKFGEKATSYIGFLAQGLGFSLYAFAYSVPLALTAATISSIGSGLIRPTLGALMSKEVGPKAQGAVFGVSQSLASIAAVVAPILAGLLIDHASVGSWALFTGVLVLIAFLF